MVAIPIDNNQQPVPPHFIQAEHGVIGGLLLDGSAVGQVCEVLSAEDFYRHDHKIIFNAIAQVAASGAPVDVLTVSDHLEKKGMLDKAGGLAYLGTLARDTPSAANVAFYAEIVRGRSVLRTIIQVGTEMAAAARQADGDCRAIISDAENRIFALAQEGLRGKRGFSRIRDVLVSVVDKMETDYNDPPKDGIRGLPSGFCDLDRITGGHSGGDLVVIAARPAMGKTSFALNIAEDVAVRQGLPVAVFSLEMQKEQLAQRMLSSNSDTPLRHVMDSWKIQDDEWSLITSSISRLGTAPLFIDDTPSLSIGDIRSRVLRLVAETADEFPNGLGAIMVDYIQLMAVISGDNRNQQIEEITRGLKRLAKELDIPVFALSQLNRNLESRPNKRPFMSDLRDSGGIEQDADLILFLYRDEVYNPETPDPGVAEVIIGKHRNGKQGTVRMLFEGQYTRFRCLANQNI